MNIFSKYRSFFISFLFLSVLQFFLINKNCSSQWYQINLPVSGTVQQMQFINSNTGWATVKQTPYVYTLIRTTNQGTNWNVIYSDSLKVINFQFINDTLGYAVGRGGYFDPINLLLKTTNKGYNWTIMKGSDSYVYGGFYMINADTGWVNAFYFPTYVTLMTTDGFQTLQQISTGGGGTPATLYFFKEKYNGQYCGYMSGSSNLWKTTNSGYYWQQINFSQSGSVNSFSFLNKDTGWVVYYQNIGNAEILYTSNSGQNWITQLLSGSYLDFGTVCAKTYEKIWSGKSNYYINASTNGGDSWGKQNCQINSSYGIYMYDTLLGFCWSSTQLAKTTNGGGPITSIIKISNEIQNNFILKQNYPNPFNSTTAIEFEIPKSSIIHLDVFDILGREVVKLIDSKELNTGSYKTIIDFENYSLSSGIYFYIFTAFEKETGKVFKLTKKLIYNK